MTTQQRKRERQKTLSENQTQAVLSEVRVAEERSVEAQVGLDEDAFSN